MAILIPLTPIPLPDFSTPTTDGWSYDGEKTTPTPTPSGGTGYVSSTQSNKLVVRYNTVNGVTGKPPVETNVNYSGVSKATTLEATIKENENGMSKGAGYYFVGWSLGSSSGPLTHAPGDTISQTWGKGYSGTVVKDMYPVFVNEKAFIYMPDDDTNEKYSRFSSKENGVPTHYAGAIFTRKGHTQTGWSTSKGGAKSYDVGASVIPDSDDIVVLYPFWEANTYQITFHGNGAVQFDQTVTIEYGSEITILRDSNSIILKLNPTMLNNDIIVLNDDTDWYLNSLDLIVVNTTLVFYREGYHIESWNESINGDGTRWLVGETYIFARESNVDLYAFWEGNRYNVYYRDPDSLPEQYIHHSIAVYGKPFYTERVSYPDEKKYCSFAGWIDDDGSDLTKSDVWFDSYYYGGSPEYSRVGDLVITRKWSPFYSFGKIFFGGKYSDEFGIYIEKPPSVKWPEYEYEHEKVLGKNGDILKDPRRYSNVTAEYDISAYDYTDYKSVSKKVSEWLHRETNGSYLRLEDSYEPDIYRLAVYEEENQLDNILGKAGKCKIAFNCKPQKFLISGDSSIEMASPQKVITNPTNHSSVPIIKIYGTGKLHINDIEIVVLANYNCIILDCETYNAVDTVGRNMNRFMYCMKSIVLKPGANAISYEDGIEKVEIIPRWWRV